MSSAIELSTLVMGRLVTLMESPISKPSEATAHADVSSSVEREEAKARIAVALAAAQQEFAIAARIETANEVEIEEYYDGSGEGSIGAQQNEKGLTLGASGGGRRVSRRVIRLKGWQSNTGQPTLATEQTDADSGG